MKRIAFLVSLLPFLLLTNLVPGQSTNRQSTVATGMQSCRAILKNDTLTLENDRIARRFRWNNGQLSTISLTDKQRQQTWQWTSRDPDCTFPGHSMPSGKGDLTTRQILNQPNQTDHLEVSVTTRLGTLDVKRVFAVYPGIAALSCTFYLRGTPSTEWREAAKQAAQAPDFKGIESQKDLVKLTGSVPAMDKLALTGNHWRLRAVEFTDMTDRNNTLVTEVPHNLYRLPGFLRGNLLWLTDGLSGARFFVLKESPVSAVQLANPGFDFVVKAGSVQTVGAGILPTDLSETEWVRGYGYTLGLGRSAVAGTTELEGLQTLRNYQDARHPRRADRDEMIMMNTWGDRNKDTKIRESFILAELQKAAQLGITHFQIDDGWQFGRSMNSAFQGGTSEGIHKNATYWTPDPARFPNGLKPITDAAQKLGIRLSLWFSPSNDSSFSDWQKDAQTLIGLYRDYGIRTMKIDLVQITDKTAEVNFRKFLDTVLVATNYEMVFNMDVTAGRRNGYHYFTEYGNLYLENRYTDWTNYYPYWTLRNVWNLSKYVPTQNLQIEFLNKWRNADKYPAGDRFAPANYAFDYLFAITMVAQPLAFFEATGLPDEGFKTAPLIQTYRKLQPEFHSGQILPVGDEPDGQSWTGFQSIVTPTAGFLLLFREDNALSMSTIKTWLPSGKRVRFQAVAGSGKAFDATVLPGGMLPVTLPAGNSFALYRYEVIK